KLFESPNIHYAGFIQMRSPEFLELVKKCSWVILPTCAEGQPGSVIECMAHGLVPILPREANIDLESWGIEIDSFDVQHLRDLIIEVSNYSEQDYIARSQAVLNSVAVDYTVEHFRNSFKKAVLTITDGAEHRID
ncbi:MAG: hypothetical protein AAF614_04145, partial [Chloroflexota bacterium]